MTSFLFQRPARSSFKEGLRYGLALLLILSLMAGTATAQAVPTTLSLGRVSGRGRVRVPLNLRYEANLGVSAVTAQIDYDPALASFVSASSAFSLSTTQPGPGRVQLTLSLPNARDLLGTALVRLDFDVLGQLDVPLSLSAASVDSVIGPLSIERISGRIDVRSGPADCDSSGALDALDLQILLNQILGLAPMTPEADVDGNGALDVRDLQSLINGVLGEARITEILPERPYRFEPFTVRGMNFGRDPQSLWARLNFGSFTENLAILSRQSNELTLIVTAQTNANPGPAILEIGELGSTTPRVSRSMILRAVNRTPVVQTLTGNPSIIPEDSPPTIITLAGVSAGASEDHYQNLQVQIQNLSPALIDNIQLQQSTNQSIIQIRYFPNQFGSVHIEISLMDDGGTEYGGVNRFSFPLYWTIESINDLPTIDPVAPISLQEDAASVSLTLTGIGPGGGSDEANQACALSLSSAPSFLVTPLISLQGNSGSLTIQVQPNASGLGSIELTLRDSGPWVSGGPSQISFSIPIEVLAVNDPPTLDPVPDQLIEFSDDWHTLPLTGVGPGPLETDAVQVLVRSSNPAIIDSVSIRDFGSERWVDFRSRSKGVTSLEVTVDDGQGPSGLVTRSIRTEVIDSAVAYSQGLFPGAEPIFRSDPRSGSVRQSIQPLGRQYNAGARALTTDPATGLIYILDESGALVLSLDPDSGRRELVMPVPFEQVNDIEFDPARGELILAGSELYAFDLRTASLRALLPPPSGNGYQIQRLCRSSQGVLYLLVGSSLRLYDAASRSIQNLQTISYNSQNVFCADIFFLNGRLHGILPTTPPQLLEIDLASGLAQFVQNPNGLSGAPYSLSQTNTGRLFALDSDLGRVLELDSQFNRVQRPIYFSTYNNTHSNLRPSTACYDENSNELVFIDVEGQLIHMDPLRGDMRAGEPVRVNGVGAAYAGIVALSYDPTTHRYFGVDNSQPRRIFVIEPQSGFATVRAQLPFLNSPSIDSLSYDSSRDSVFFVASSILYEFSFGNQQLVLHLFLNNGDSVKSITHSQNQLYGSMTSGKIIQIAVPTMSQQLLASCPFGALSELTAGPRGLIGLSHDIVHFDLQSLDFFSPTLPVRFSNGGLCYANNKLLRLSGYQNINAAEVLFSVDPISGEVRVLGSPTLRGPSGQILDPEGLCFDSGSNALLFVDRSGAGLYSLDLTTLQNTLIASSDAATTLAFDPATQSLFNISAGQLQRLDRSSGAQQLIAPARTTVSPVIDEALGFSPQRQQLLNLIAHSDGPTRLLQISPLGAVAVLRDPVVQARRFRGFVWALPASSHRAPSINLISAQSFVEDSSLSLSITGIQANDPQEIVTRIAAGSSDPNILAIPQINYSPGSSTATLLLRGRPDAFTSSPVTVTLRIFDNGPNQNSSTRSFPVTILAVNDPPRVASQANLTISLPLGPVLVPLPAFDSGADNENQTVSVRFTSSSGAIVSGQIIPPSSLELTPLSAGTATGTLIFDDGQSSNNTTSLSFSIQVVPTVDNPPTVATYPPSVSLVEDDFNPIFVDLSGISAADAGQAISSVQASASDPTKLEIVSNGLIGNFARIAVRPFPNAFTTSPIDLIIQVRDSGLSRNETILTIPVDIAPINDPPSFSVNPSMTFSFGTQVLTLQSVSAGPGETEPLTFNFRSSDPAILPTPSIAGFGASRLITLSPLSGGRVQLTVEVDDGLGGLSSSQVDIDFVDPAQRTIFSANYLALRRQQLTSGFTPSVPFERSPVVGLGHAVGPAYNPQDGRLYFLDYANLLLASIHPVNGDLRHHADLRNTATYSVGFSYTGPLTTRIDTFFCDSAGTNLYFHRNYNNQILRLNRTSGEISVPRSAPSRSFTNDILAYALDSQSRFLGYSPTSGVIVETNLTGNSGWSGIWQSRASPNTSAPSMSYDEVNNTFYHLFVDTSFSTPLVEIYRYPAGGPGSFLNLPSDEESKIRTMTMDFQRQKLYACEGPVGLIREIDPSSNTIRRNTWTGLTKAATPARLTSFSIHHIPGRDSLTYIRDQDIGEILPQSFGNRHVSAIPPPAANTSFLFSASDFQPFLNKIIAIGDTFNGSPQNTLNLYQIDPFSGQYSSLRLLTAQAVKEIASDPIRPVMYYLNTNNDLIEYFIQTQREVIGPRIQLAGQALPSALNGLAARLEQGVLALYSTDDQYRLLKINPTNGQAQVIGPYGFGKIISLTNYLDKLAGITDQADIVIIDPITGEGCSLRPTTGKIHSLSYDRSQHKILALGASEFSTSNLTPLNLYEIDPLSGTTRYRQGLPTSFGDYAKARRCLGVDPSRNELALLVPNNSSPPHISTISLTTGSQRTLSAAPINSSYCKGMAFDPINDRYLILDYTQGGNDRLWELPASGGTATLLANLSRNYYNLCFDSSRSTLLLCSTGEAIYEFSLTQPGPETQVSTLVGYQYSLTVR